MLPSVAGNARNEPLARNVIGVFNAYKHRLRSLGVPSNMRSLGNTERNLVGQIVKRPRTAVNVLANGGDNISLALDRACANGETIEQLLNQLSDCLKSRTESNVPEIYCPGYKVPPIPDNVCIDFDTRDEKGNYACPEGYLKRALITSTARKTGIAPRRAARSGVVHGASGMAGVGKTTAAIALGHDEEVRSHFSNEILFIRLGADTSLLKVHL